MDIIRWGLTAQHMRKGSRISPCLCSHFHHGLKGNYSCQQLYQACVTFSLHFYLYLYLRFIKEAIQTSRSFHIRSILWTCCRGYFSLTFRLFPAAEIERNLTHFLTECPRTDIIKCVFEMQQSTLSVEQLALNFVSEPICVVKSGKLHFNSALNQIFLSFSISEQENVRLQIKKYANECTAKQTPFTCNVSNVFPVLTADYIPFNKQECFCKFSPTSRNSPSSIELGEDETSSLNWLKVFPTFFLFVHLFSAN